MSLDGFFEGPDHDVMALPFDQGFGEYNVERLKTADTLLLGKTTFDNFLGTSRASVGPSAALHPWSCSGNTCQRSRTCPIRSRPPNDSPSACAYDLAGRPCENGAATGELMVVSGTHELKGAAGSGTFKADPEGSITLNLTPGATP